MKPSTPPANAVAVIVGIEQSSLYAFDPLIGPVSSALRLFEWLVRRGLEPARIRMFLSPKPASLPEIDAWQALFGQPYRPADQKTLRDFFDVELGRLAARERPGALIVWWSGHGVIDQRSGVATRSRRVFFADAIPGAARNVEALGLLTAMRSTALAAFPEQLLLVDTCASFSTGLIATEPVPAPESLGLTGFSAAATRQFAALAASPGQLAMTGEPDGAAPTTMRFTQRLLDALSEPPEGSWPDFAAAFATTRRQFADEDQTPTSWAWGGGDDALNDDGLALSGTAAATRLARAIAAIAPTPEPALLRGAFLSALELTLPAQTHEAAMRGGLLAMLEMLQFAPPSRAGTRIQGFALQLAARLPEVEASGIVAWLGRERGAAGVGAALTALRTSLARPTGDVCFLLVTEDPHAADGGPCYDAWLFFEDDPVPLRVSGAEALEAGAAPPTRSQALGELIGLAKYHAFDRGLRDARLVIELVLPLDRIESELDALAFNDGFRDRRLDRHFMVVRRLVHRQKVLQLGDTRQGFRYRDALERWRRRADELRPRLARFGMRLLWIDPPEVLADQLTRALGGQAECSCVALRTALDAGALSGPARECLARDIPFACWPTDAWSDGDTRAFESAMAGFLDRRSLPRLFDLREEAGFTGHPATKLAVLWDDPGHNPYLKLSSEESR